MLSKRSITLIVLIITALLLCFGAVSAQADTVTFKLSAGMHDGQRVFLGVDGEIRGQSNPTLSVPLGANVEITLLNIDGQPFDFAIPDLAISAESLSQIGAQATVNFTASDELAYAYLSSSDASMQGVLRVGNAPETAAAPAIETVEAAPESVEAPAGDVVEYTVKTIIGGNPAMSFIGVGGSIEGQTNPILTANLGQTVRLTVINGDPTWHDLTIEVLGLTTGQLLQKDQTAVIEFVADQPGEFTYICSVPGHKDIGMKGLIQVNAPEGTVVETQTAAPTTQTVAAEQPVTPAAENAVSIVRHPADLPAPVGQREPQTLRIEMETVEVTGQLADGTTFSYFTFDGQVPGPMIRVRVGDTVELHLKNATTSLFPHSIDLHAVTGPGGGAVYTQTLPGENNMFTFKALNPGLYVYHCATASIPHHISSGMYGLILVEPEGGLPPVDREFYVMQGEIYTVQPYGTAGHLDFSMDHMSHEDADYILFNGAVGGLTTDDNALRANVGETVRIYFGVGGPNYTSAFHVIGEIFDRVYDQASLTAAPLTDVQTTVVPPGGAAMVEFKVDVPGRYILVDHALSRLERGAAGYLIVDGEDQPDIFTGSGEANMAGH